MLRQGITELLTDEFIISTARSGGPGGQNVNKSNTKVEIRLKIDESQVLTQEEKSIILDRLKNRINCRGELIVISQRYRSQLKNRQDGIKKMFRLIYGALAQEKERIETRPTERSQEERLEKKHLRSVIKKMRGSHDEKLNE